MHSGCRTFKFLSRTFCLWIASQLALESRFWLLNRSFWFLHRSFLFLKSVMLVAEANFLTILIPFIHFIRVIRWAYWLLGFSACPMASRLGFSASRLVRWLLGSASRLARRLLGFAASRLASLLLGFSACPVVSWSHFWAPFTRAL